MFIGKHHLGSCVPGKGLNKKWFVEMAPLLAVLFPKELAD